MSDDMFMPDDWVPATLINVAHTTVTFSAAGATVVRDLPSLISSVFYACYLNKPFEFSAARNAVRTADGEEWEFPAPPAPRRVVDKDECQSFSPGHKPYWVPALRSIREPGEKVPVTLISVEGKKLTFATPDGELTVYNHDPERCGRAIEYLPDWELLKGPLKRNEHGHPSYEMNSVSLHPLGECTAEEI